jgi:hypothetical protein
MSDIGRIKSAFLSPIPAIVIWRVTTEPRSRERRKRHYVVTAQDRADVAAARAWFA